MDDDAEVDGYRVPAPIPDIAPTLEEIERNATAKLSEQIGQGLRSALGIGALALLPDLISDLRKSRDPDTRLKFIGMAMKEGGYGTKDNKNDNLPTFNFTFNGVGGTVSVQAVQTTPADEPEKAETVEYAEYPDAAIARLRGYAGINDDVAIDGQPAESSPSAFSLIE